jgi:hypothetical protein
MARAGVMTDKPKPPPTSPDDPRVTPDALDKLLDAIKADTKNSRPNPTKE